MVDLELMQTQRHLSAANETKPPFSKTTINIRIIPRSAQKSCSRFKKWGLVNTNKGGDDDKSRTLYNPRDSLFSVNCRYNH